MVNNNNPRLAGSLNSSVDASNMLTDASRFVIDGQRLRRIRLSSPAD